MAANLILPAFVLATVAVLAWSIVASRKRSNEPVPARVRAAVTVALLLGVAAALWLLLIPSYASMTETQATGGSSSVTRGTATLVGANGLVALIPLLLPLVLLAAPVVGWRSPARRVITLACAILLTAFVVVASFSIGFFFLPATVVLWVAVSDARSAPRTA